ncbi:hypothetical protein [Hamadaea tsunoensis]|uniref:hypothetical protein n=1 Tax=Hamadaea tsunoensis TaxID=53368 RepID=UPI000413A255|nr:hypothetical protein [Hamadaea tsunoensis]
MLFELVSMHYAREAAKDMPANPELTQQKAEAKAALRQMKMETAARFSDVILTDDPSRWSIEGHGYPSWTAITASWAQAHDTGVNGGALYNLMSVLGHPQGFAATFGLRFDREGVRIITMEGVDKLVRLAIASFYSALALLASYTGHRPKVLTEWEEEIDRVLPGLLIPDRSA